MVNVIEIIDSDEESSAQPVKEQTADAVQSEVPTNAVSKVDCMENTVEPESAAVEAAEPQDAANAEKNKNKNRRKAVHQVMRASPEMQFQTITFDENKKKRRPRRKNLTQVVNGAENGNDTDNSTSTPPVEEVDSELLIKPPTAAEVLSAACDELLNLEKAHEMIRQVAEYRIRINFLLNACSMKEMPFTLGSDLERLKIKFNQRLNQSNSKKFAADRIVKSDAKIAEGAEPCAASNGISEAAGVH